MVVSEHVALEPRDVVAASIPPGPRWLDLVAETWAAGSALLPVDHRLPEREAGALIERAGPTVLLEPGNARRIDGRPADPGVALILPTSGTGGAPKLVQLEGRAVDAAVASSADRLGADRRDRWLCCLPLANVGGLMVLVRAALLDAPVTVHPRFDLSSMTSVGDVAYTSLVPTMLKRLLDAGVDLSGFRAVLVGGARLPHDLRERAEGVGARVIETYGLTETCGGVVYDGETLPGTEVRVDADGAILLRGPTLMSGYRSDPEGTQEAFTDDGWLRTGDVGEIDRDGRLHVVGRSDDLIITGGEKVWPNEVESALRGHPAIIDVAVGGRPDPDWGQHVAAWVVPADPASPPSLDDLRAFASRTLPRHRIPRELILVDELPRTPSGKLRRGALPRD